MRTRFSVRNVPHGRNLSPHGKPPQRGCHRFIIFASITTAAWMLSISTGFIASIGRDDDDVVQASGKSLTFLNNIFTISDNYQTQSPATTCNKKEAHSPIIHISLVDIYHVFTFAVCLLGLIAPPTASSSLSGCTLRFQIAPSDVDE